MPPNLLPTEPLSQVVFIHDYVQLVFQNACLSLYSRVALFTNGKEIYQAEDGFADALTRLIGKRVIQIGATSRSKLEVKFEGGTVVWLLRGKGNEFGPEAYQYNDHEGLIVVEQNA